MRQFILLLIVGVVCIICSSLTVVTPQQTQQVLPVETAAYSELVLVEPSPLDFVPAVFVNIIVDSCLENNVPIYHFCKMLEIESRFNPRCVSAQNPNGSYDYGIAQFNSAYIEDFAQRYDFEDFDPFDPMQSIQMATKHLSVLYKHTGDWKLAFAAYNAGLSRIRSGKIPARTEHYIQYIFGGGST